MPVEITRLIESRNGCLPNGLIHRITLFTAFAALVLLDTCAFAQAPPVVWTEPISALNSTNYGGGGLSAVDDHGDVFFAGDFNLPIVSVGSQTLTNLSVGAGFGDAVGTLDVFVAKYNSAGNFLWARQIGGDGADAVRATATDPAGNLLVLVNSRSPKHFKRHEHSGDQPVGRRWCGEYGVGQV
jgi:hypothetical protein